MIIDDAVIKIPTELECATCDAKKPLWTSQRGMILVVLAVALAYMWTVAMIATVKYEMTVDMTTINAMTVAVTALAGWYSYTKGKETEKLAEIKQK
jgi:hypothetical protein